MLTGWALAGRGIVMKPLFEVAAYVASGALVITAEAEPPSPAQLACLFPHKRLLDPKSRAFIDFMLPATRRALAEALGALSQEHPPPRETSAAG